MSTVKKICFDKILPIDLRHANQIGTRALTPIGKLWVNGSTLRIRFMEGTADRHEIVKRYAIQWTQHANLNFEFTNAPDADIRITFANDGAWSYIGTDAKSIHVSQPTMNFGWLDEAVVLHEFGHAIGLGHEHQNPLGGIQWNEEAVIRDLSGPPNGWDIDTIRFNVLDKYQRDQINGTEFDPKSIMLYSFPAEWTIGGFRTEENTKLSDMDKAFAAGAQMYPGRDRPDNGTQVVELNVTEVMTTEASIGNPGEEDLFKFTARSSGDYTIETEGNTDLIMKLYGPNSQTQLIAEDDDNGPGSNPRIDANLAPGEYFIQVRHYNRAGGTGTYGIKVFK